MTHAENIAEFDQHKVSLELGAITQFAASGALNKELILEVARLLCDYTPLTNSSCSTMPYRPWLKKQVKLTVRALKAPSVSSSDLRDAAAFRLLALFYTHACGVLATNYDFEGNWILPESESFNPSNLLPMYRELILGVWRADYLARTSDPKL